LARLGNISAIEEMTDEEDPIDSAAAATADDADVQ